MSLNRAARHQLIGDAAVAGVIVLFAALNWFRPHLLANEAVYLLPPLQWWHAGALATDWTWGGDPWQSTSLLFSWFAAPLWGLSESPETVALIGRALSWSLLGYSLARLGRAMGLAGPFVAMGAAAWLMTGQGFAAGEWVFLGFERKPLAHAAAFMSMAAMVRDRPVVSGAWAGASAALHVLVGGWFALAVGAGHVARYGLRQRRAVIAFAGAAALVAAPFVALSVTYLLSPVDGPQPAPGRLDWLATVFRNPHHTLPSHFLDARRNAWFIGLALCAGWGAARSLPRPAARGVIAVLMVAVLAYGIGWWAGKQQWYWLLKYYPFRMGDVLVPLLTWLLVPTALVRAWRTETALSVLAASLLLYTAAQLMPPGVQRVGDTWRSWPRGEPAMEKLGAWARAATSPDAVFIVPPCTFDFWVRARRPVVVSYKAMPHSARAISWYERLQAVGGGAPISGTGFAVCRQVDAGEATLSRSALTALKRRYQARYYLLRGRRADLRDAEVYRDLRFAVYDIRRFENPLPSKRTKSKRAHLGNSP